MTISITIHGEVLTRLDQIEPRLRAALESKFSAAIDAIYQKALIGLGGAKESADVISGVERQGDLLIGYIEPVTIKAQVQEFGGKSWYVIPVGSKGVLANPKDDFLSRRDVMHPPLRGKHYILEAIREGAPSIEAAIRAAIEEGTR